MTVKMMIDDGTESVLAGILFAESKISQRQRKTDDAKESLQVKQGKKRKQLLRPRLHGLISGIGRNCTELHAFCTGLPFSAAPSISML